MWEYDQSSVQPQISNSFWGFNLSPKFLSFESFLVFFFLQLRNHFSQINSFDKCQIRCASFHNFTFIIFNNNKKSNLILIMKLAWISKSDMERRDSQSRIQESFPILNKWFELLALKWLRSSHSHIFLSTCVRTCYVDSFFVPRMNKQCLLNTKHGWMRLQRHPFHLGKNSAFRISAAAMMYDRRLLLSSDEIAAKYLHLVYLLICRIVIDFYESAKQNLVELQNMREILKGFE